MFFAVRDLKSALTYQKHPLICRAIPLWAAQSFPYEPPNGAPKDWRAYKLRPFQKQFID